MIKNYLLTALRNMRNNWYYTTINIVGLKINAGQSIFILLVFLLNELKLETTAAVVFFFHESQRLYNVVPRDYSQGSAFHFVGC